MGKALFFRKCKSKQDLKWHYNYLYDFGQELEYKIIKTITLSEHKYNEFIKNFFKSYDFINKYSNISYMDNNDCVYCLLIQSKNKSGILVYPSGYSYARYTALYKPHIIKGGDTNV